MKYLILIALLLFTGCTSINVKYPDGSEFNYSSTKEFGEIKVERDPATGKITGLHVKGVQNKLAQEIAAAIITGMKSRSN